MAATKTIAIVGATGKSGTAIAKKLAAVGERVLLISTAKNKLDILGQNIKTTWPQAIFEIIDCAREACWEADLVILAIPPTAEKEVALKIKEVATQKIVVRMLPVQSTTSFAANYINELHQLLPNSKIVTAFINPAALHATAIAGSDEEAVQTIINIAVKAGFNVAVAAEL